ARARRHRGGGRAPADRDRGGRSGACAAGRPHAGVRPQGPGARAGAAAGGAAVSDQDRIRFRSWQIMISSAAITGNETGARLSIRLHLIVGIAVVVVLAGGLGGWASTAQISGALIAPGAVVVDSNVKKVQHPTGGVVGEVRVRDGDRVKAGDTLVRLDETVTRANLAIVHKGLIELYARKARLAAERDGTETVTTPKDLADKTGDAD